MKVKLSVELKDKVLVFYSDAYGWEYHYGRDGNLTEITLKSKSDSPRDVWRIWKPVLAREEEVE